MSLTFVIIAVLVLGFIAWAIGKSPVTDPEFKSIARFVLLVIAVIVVVYFFLGLSHAGTIPLR